MADILVIDDETQWLDFAREALEAAGHRVETVSDSWLSFRIARNGEHDAVVLDLSMPLHGRAILWYLNRYRPGLPVILYTVHQDCRDDPQFRGAADIVVKSPHPADLVYAVEDTLSGAPA